MQKPPSTPIRYALHCTSRHKRWALGAFCAVTTAEVLQAVQLTILKLLTDSVVESSATGSLATSWRMGTLYALIFFVLQSTWRVSGFCGMRWNTRVESTSYKTLFAYLTGHSSNYFNNRFAGALTNKISNATRGIRSIMSKVLWEFYPLVFGFITFVYLAYTADVTLAVALTTWMIIFLSINIFLANKKRPLAYRYAETSSVLKGKMVDSASNISTVQQSGHLRFERDYINEFIDEQRTAHFTSWWYSEWILFLNGALLAINTFIMIGLCIMLLEKNLITVGTVVMIIGIVVSLQRSLFFIGQRLAETMDDYGLIKEGLEDLLLPHEIIDAEDAKPIRISSAGIRWESVNFSYGKLSVFSDFNLTIEPGQKVGLVGYSGAGKTTFVHLLLRNFNLDSGRICIDDQDISNVTIESLRQNIAMVPQDVSLFHRSVKENIRYGRLNATDEEVMEAAELAQAHEFISDLPDGYETFVGERGVKLSGGQRQRIAVARAIVRNAPLLILDEATSSLDSKSEAAIQKALAKLMTNKTVIAVAHRLSTLKAMDRLLVLDKGKLLEDGTHQELLALGGVYSKLWNSQVDGMIQDDRQES